MSNFAPLPEFGSGSSIEKTEHPSSPVLLFSPKKVDMKTNTFKILFFIRKEKADRITGECPIYARITVDKRTEISLNKAVNPTKWDVNRQCIKGNSPEAKAINDFISSFEVRVHNCYTLLFNKGEAITADVLKQHILGKSEQNKTALELFEYLLSQIKNSVGKTYSISTFKKYEYCYAHLKNFIFKNYRAEDLPLTKVDYYFVRQFHQYLLQPAEFKDQSGTTVIKKANDHNSALKYIKMFKTVLREGLANKWITNDPFALFKDKFIEVEQVFLNIHELEKLINYDIPNEVLTVTRDIFIFSCFTGLCFADYEKLTKNDIVLGIDKSRWIVTGRTKTNTGCRIPILPIVESILQKYERHPKCLNSGKLLPVPCNQTMNSQLKEIADIAKVNKNICTHVGRRTFATIAINIGVPPETIIKIIGHKGFRHLHLYAKANDEKTLLDIRALGERFGAYSDAGANFQSLSLVK